MDVSSKASGLSRKNAEDYGSLEEVLADVELLTQNNFILTQAGDVIERYLRKRSPNFLTSLERPIERIATRESIVSRRSASLSVSRESTSFASQGSSPVLTSRSMMQSSIGVPRVNLLYRVEMVERELEDGKLTMDKLRRRFESAKFLLQVEEENLKQELQTVEEDEKNLDVFMADNTEKKTGRLFLDKISRYLENELNSKDRDLRKMKLKTKTYQTEYSRLKSQQQQKLELRERLHPVDLDKLLIENQELLEMLEEKSRHLLDLKRTVGRKGQSLVLLKSRLNDTILSLGNIAQDIKHKEMKYAFTETKETQNVNDLMAAEILNHSIKKLHSTYKSPDVHSYLMMEVTLNELRREKDAWERRCRYQRQTLTLLEHQMKQIAPNEMRTRSNKSIISYKSKKSLFTSRSVDSLPRRQRINTPYPTCSPTTPKEA